MAGVNKVIIVGNLGDNPEVRYSQQGKAIANISVATSETWKDQSGQRQERTEWHRIVLFRRLAEIAGEYLTKGSKVYIEGKLQTRKWQDQQGQDRYTTEVVADQMQMLDSLKQNNNAPNQGAHSSQSAPQRKPAKSGAGSPPPSNDFDDQDIPF